MMVDDILVSRYIVILNIYLFGETEGSSFFSFYAHSL